ncbi:MAG: GntR family transcriptional regulator [Opitutaceae bacterium]
MTRPRVTSLWPSMESAEDTFQTKSSRVYAEIRQAITDETFKPGQHLVRRDLVKQFNVSLSIVNEVLARLGTDGLVETKEMYGTRVIRPDPENIRNDFALREAIERHVARLLAENASTEQLQSLLEDARSLDRWMATESQAGIVHLEFHLKLARATGLKLLEQTLKRAGVRSLLTSRWLKRQATPHPPDFHEQLVRAIMVRDPRIADEKMRDHLHYNETIDFRPSSTATAAESR